jgi:hypothetical protein
LEYPGPSSFGAEKQRTPAREKPAPVAVVGLQPPRAMGCLLPDQAFVRLRNRTYGMYLYAHEDGAAVVLKPHRACLQTVWQLHRILRADRNLNYILFRSAAYGRYLTLSRETSPIYPGHSHQVNHTFQGVYETPMQDDVLWVIASADNLHAVIFHATYRVLRSSPSNMLLFGHAFVVGDIYHPVNYGTTIHWTVEEIPVRPEPPVIHLPTDVSSPSPTLLSLQFFALI